MYDNHANVLNQSHARYDNVVIYDNFNELNACITNHSPLSGVSLNGMIMIVQSLQSMISHLMQHCTIQHTDTLNDYLK